MVKNLIDDYMFSRRRPTINKLIYSDSLALVDS